MLETNFGIFDPTGKQSFEDSCLRTFEFQYSNTKVYKEFCDHLGKTPTTVKSIFDIPFLPIEFFKSKKIIASNKKPDIIYSSSGTTGSIQSQHYVIDINVYKESFKRGFEFFYGPINDYCILALLPAYLERQGSSLIYMVNEMMLLSGHPKNGFFLYDHKKLKTILEELDGQKQKTLLIGVSFALLDFTEEFQLDLLNTVIMETGGMKGRKKEITREELHKYLSIGFGVDQIHSEYGMTELLSQAYSQGNGRFKCPPWMKVFARDTEDPLSIQKTGKTGGLNIIDLANKNSCSFIATQDLGRFYEDGSFEVLGRFDNSDIRGCNLMAI
ncbi:acyl transferase [Croceivirga thetidis]|uniref:Acyl transferase n=1 Tax=Croceivirga thetidis TaxID=2721623 RepID=A0ABX1GNT6_9FLAO|nr:acyl transferase [Croceivirga thetidis]NKI31591.1 acyl transferase [Croceivirga thetidis]